MSIMDQVKRHLREWYSLAADRTGEMAKISVRMYDKYGISREIERQLSELGCFVYHAVEAGRGDFLADENFRAAIARIQGLERDLSLKVSEIESIRQQRQQKSSARQLAAADAAGAPPEAPRDVRAPDGAAEPASPGDSEPAAEPSSSADRTD